MGQNTSDAQLSCAIQRLATSPIMTSDLLCASQLSSRMSIYAPSMDRMRYAGSSTSRVRALSTTAVAPLLDKDGALITYILCTRHCSAKKARSLGLDQQVGVDDLFALYE